MNIELTSDECYLIERELDLIRTKVMYEIAKLNVTEPSHMILDVELNNYYQELKRITGKFERLRRKNEAITNEEK